MKKLIFSAALVLSLGLAACGDSESDKEVENTASTTQENQTTEVTKEETKEAVKEDVPGEVTNGPLTKAGEWTMDGDNKVTLTKIKDVNEVYTLGPINLTIDSIKLLHHSKPTVDTVTYIQEVHGKDISDGLSTIQVIYSVENTTDDNIMFHAIKTLTTDTKTQIEGMYDMAQTTDSGTYMGEVDVEGLTILPYFSGDLNDINSINILTGDVWDNDNPTKLADSQKITISF